MDTHVDNNGLARASKQSGSNYNSRSKSNGSSNGLESSSLVTDTSTVLQNQTYESRSSGDERIREALKPLNLSEKQKREALDAWYENPDGCERVALFAMGAMSPAGAFLSLIRKGKHREPQHEPIRYTGWRFVRGSHGGTYKRDPKGRDILPQGYDLTPAREPQRFSDNEPDDLTAQERDANAARFRELSVRIGREMP